MTITIDQDAQGQRADVFLAAHLQVSRARAQKIVESATLNGQSLKSKTALKEGDVLEFEDIVPAQEGRSAVAEEQEPLPPILYEDDDLLVLDKPRGLTVHAGAGDTQSTLVEVLRANGRTLSTVGPADRAGIVHRLDKDTTGLMIVCKTDAAHWKLAADFEARRVRKTYLALVCGVPKPRGRVEAPIARHPVQRQKQTVAASGRPAITEYKVLSSWPKFALVEINLMTGRTHQIRVHFQYLGNAVVGDSLYGGLKRGLEAASDENLLQALQELRGQALHSSKLKFIHPISGEELEFEVPLPNDFQRVVDALGPDKDATQSTLGRFPKL
ncbi:MAG: rRNA synthase [Abditibacteriota bacterium]|nr:rRNA synthase [Abditibacteriota bacterium]